MRLTSICVSERSLKWNELLQESARHISACFIFLLFLLQSNKLLSFQFNLIFLPVLPQFRKLACIYLSYPYLFNLEKVLDFPVYSEHESTKFLKAYYVYLKPVYIFLMKGAQQISVLLSFKRIIWLNKNIVYLWLLAVDLRLSMVVEILAVFLRLDIL